jgi:putative PIN family toxin of toxin-antitoxin system
MKIVFDTNVYVAEALLGEAAEEMVTATVSASWRIYATAYLLDEFERVMIEKLGVSQRFASLSRQRIARRAKTVESAVSHHAVLLDAADTPILRAAISVGADFLVTNDHHLLDLDPYEGVRIVSMSHYRQVLITEGLIHPL